ncbi:YrbL family protein [Caballeronia sp. LZ001]|uniref:YrbL family protein n=1 Tax=Caballeronia sp. LZ001 TaxID=3038553 RepID=UPI0038D35C8C
MIPDREQCFISVLITTMYDDDTITLVTDAPVAWGSRRLVYIHPAKPSLLLKVAHRMKPAHGGLGRLAGTGRRLLAIYDQMVMLRREVTEYQRVDQLNGGFLQICHGTLRTDIGIALIVEAIRTPSGSLAPTLHELITTGRFRGRVRLALEPFIGQLLPVPPCWSTFIPGTSFTMNS